MTVKFRNDEQARDAMESAQRDLDNAAYQTRTALNDYRRATRAALRDPMIPDGGKVYKVGELRKQTTEKLRQIEQNARAAQGKAKEAAEYLTRDQRTVGEMTRDDQRMRLAWDRAQMMLNAGIPAHEVVTRAADQGDRLTIEAMEFFAPTYLEADIRGRGGSLNDIGHDTEALRQALTSAKAATASPAETVLGDLGEQAEAVEMVATRARDEVAGGDPIAALHVDLPDGVGDFSETVGVARENAALLNQMGGGDAARRAS